MLGLVLVMHDPLGAAMMACIKHVMGTLPEQFEVVDVESDAPIEVTVKAIEAAAQTVDSGQGVVLLTDLFGATPSNAAVRACVENLKMPSVLVAGCNLPMILRALGFRELPVGQAGDKLVMGGRNGIVSTGATAPQEQLFHAKDNDSARDQHQQ